MITFSQLSRWKPSGHASVHLPHVQKVIKSFNFFKALCISFLNYCNCPIALQSIYITARAIFSNCVINVNSSVNNSMFSVLQDANLVAIYLGP